MLDDIRNHDPKPTPEERAWMHTDLPKVLASVVSATLLIVGLGLGEAWFRGVDAAQTPDVASTSAAASSRAS